MLMAVMKVPLIEKVANSFPNNNWKAVAMIRYAEPYQPTSSMVLKSNVILGIAVVMIVWSYDIRMSIVHFEKGVNVGSK